MHLNILCSLEMWFFSEGSLSIWKIMVSLSVILDLYINWHQRVKLNVENYSNIWSACWYTVFIKFLVLSEYLYLTARFCRAFKSSLKAACCTRSLKSQRNLIALYPQIHLCTDVLFSELCTEKKSLHHQRQDMIHACLFIRVAMYLGLSSKATAKK